MMKESQNSYQIFVNTPSKVLSLKNIPPDLPIIQLKSIVELKSGIPVEQQELFLAGNRLPNALEIHESGLRDKYVLRLAFKTKAAEALFEMVQQEDLAGILNTGVQWIDLSEANNDEERRRLVVWNENATNRAFLAVCVACVNGILHLVGSLLKLSAFAVNRVTSFGRSALHFAAMRGSIGCVCILLDNNIDPNIEDCDGKTAQDLSEEYGHIHCKRRIWLFRWSITPIKRKRGSSEKNDKNGPNSSQESRQDEESEGVSVRFPSLEKRPATSHYKDEGYEIEASSPLPEVNQPIYSVNNIDRKHGEVRLEEFSEMVDNDRDFYLVNMDLTANSKGNGTKFVELDKTTRKYDAMEQNKRVFNQKSSTMKQNKLIMEQSIAVIEQIEPIMEQNWTKKETVEHGTQTVPRESNLAHLVGKFGYKITEDSLLKRQTGRTWLSSSLQNRNVRIQDFGKTDMNNNYRVNDSPRSQIRKAAKKEKEYEFPKEPTKTLDETRDTVQIHVISSEGEVQKLDTKTSEHEGGTGHKPLKGTDNLDAKPPSAEAMTRPVSAENMARPALELDKQSTRTKTSFNEWLEKKERDRKAKQAEDNSNIAEESQARKETNEQAFKKWLQQKKVQQRRGSAFSARPTEGDTNKEKISMSGLSFESWMQRKRRDQPRSLSLPETRSHVVANRSYSSGMTYEEWKLTKRKQDVGLNMAEDRMRESRSSRPSGITFDTWMATKQELTQIEKVRQATAQLQQQYQKEMDYQRKLKNPRVKTFEEWQLSKKYQERLQKSKQKKDEEKRRVKYEEDSKLVFNMWLMNKHLYEMQVEEEEIENARKLWEKKKKKLLVDLKTKQI